MTRPLVLYHGPSCADGHCSAFIAWLKFGDGADYVPVNYGDPVPDVTGRKVFLLDFSYPLPVLLEMARKVVDEEGAITLIDHHVSAQKDLTPLIASGADFGYSSRIRCIFDMAHSGARLTWDFFFPGKKVPWLVNYVEDRDLWTWQLFRSKEVSAAIASYPKDFNCWSAWMEEGPLMDRCWQALADEGTAILRYQEQQVWSQVENATEVTIEGHKVLAVNATMLISEIAGALALNRPFGATYFINSKGQKVWSLRSRNGGVDVSDIAKRHGGGGHPASSGYIEG